MVIHGTFIERNEFPRQIEESRHLINSILIRVSGFARLRSILFPPQFASRTTGLIEKCFIQF